MQDTKYRPIVIPKATMDLLLKQDKPSDLIALYVFYYYTSVWQETNQPKAVTKYAAKGLGWGIDKVRRVKKTLISIGLVSDVINRKDDKSIEGWYIQVNYCWGKDAIETEITHPMEKARGGEKQGVAKTNTNACSSGKVNACSNNNKKNTISKKPKEDSNIGIPTKEEVEQHFRPAYNLYPGSKGEYWQTYHCFIKGCKDNYDLITELPKLLPAIQSQIKDRASTKDFRPPWKSFANWLNVCHWYEIAPESPSEPGDANYYPTSEEIQAAYREMGIN